MFLVLVGLFGEVWFCFSFCLFLSLCFIFCLFSFLKIFLPHNNNNNTNNTTNKKKGMNYVNSTPDLDPKSGFTTEAAPRTALGVDKNGAIWLVQADGQEKADFGFGLYEFAEVFVFVFVFVDVVS